MGEVLQGPGAQEAAALRAAEPKWFERAATLFDQINILPQVSEAYRAQAIVCLASALRVAYLDGCVFASQQMQEFIAKAQSDVPGDRA